MESYSVEAVLSAVDKGFSRQMNGALNTMNGLQKASGSALGGIMKIATGIGVFKAVSAVTSLATSGIVGMGRELSNGSKTWKTFNSNMEIMKKSPKEIARVKNELQDFATDTIYSASDMATTYSQLSAVGIKSADELVKGFGGLAAAAENPEQAMKTLSQQATQMAAKPKVQWMDFKLMLEQTPAGIAAVAKTMGKTTAQLVQDVQSGTISTQEFFDAMQKTGTSDAFKKLATEYKDVGQAMDGLQETMTNKLQPAFDVVSKVGIDAISKITDSLDGVHFDRITAMAQKLADILGNKLAKVNFDEIVSKVNDFISIFDHMITGADMTDGAMDTLKNTISSLMPILALVGSALALKGAIPSIGLLSKGFEVVQSSVGALGGTLGKVTSKASSFFYKLSSGLPSIYNGIGTGLTKASQVGVSALSGMTSALGSIISVALQMVGPAAIVGLALAGMGLVYSQFGDQIDQMLDLAITKGPEVITNFVNGITQALPALISSGADLVVRLVDVIVANLPTLVNSGIQVISSLVQGVVSALPKLIPAALSLVTTIVNTLITAVPQLLMIGMQLLLSLVQGIVASIPQIVSSVSSILTTFVSTITSYLPQVISTGIQILLTLVDGITQMLPQLLPVAVQAVTQLIQGLVNAIPMLINGAVQLVTALCNFIVQNAPMLLDSAVQLIQALVSGIAQSLPSIISGGIQIIMTLITTIVQLIPSIISAGWDIVKALGSGIMEAIPNVLQGAWDGIKNGFSNLWNTITGKSSETSGKVSSDGFAMSQSYDSSMQSMYSSASTNTSGISSAIGSNMGTAASAVNSNASQMESNANGAFDAINNLGTVNFDTLQSNITSASSTANANASSQASSMASNVNNSTDDIASNSAKSFTTLENNAAKSFGNVNKTASNQMNSLKSTMTSSANAINVVIKSMFTNIGTVSTAGFNKMRASTVSTMNQVRSSVTSGMRSVVMAFRSGFNNAVSVANSARSRISSTVSSLSSSLYSSGVYAMYGLRNGLWAGAGGVFAAASAIANIAAARIRSALRVHSPSRVTREIGGFTGEGLELGLLDKVKSVGKAATSLANEVSGNIAPSVDLNGSIAKSNNAINSSIDHELSVSQKPAYINLSLGGKTYRAFVSDISDEQDRQVNLDLAFS